MASKNAARCGSPCTASFGEPHPPDDPAQTPRRHYSRAAFGIVACACRSGPDLAGMLPDACGPIGRPRAPGLHPGFRSETPPGAGRTHATPHRFTACPGKARYSLRTQTRPHPPTDGPGPAPDTALPPAPGRPGMPSGEGAVSMRQGRRGKNNTVARGNKICTFPQSAHIVHIKNMENQPEIPKEVRERFDVYEWRHGISLLQAVHPIEWEELVSVLGSFQLLRSEILAPGGRKSPIAEKIDGKLYSLGWVEKAFDTRIKVDEVEYETPTHSVDCYKNRVAIEVEWNNKDPFYDRDLNNFRLLFDLRAIDVGVIITRCSELQEIFKKLGKGSSYGASTTHVRKLLPHIDGGGGGGCPIVVFGIKKEAYVDD